MYQKFSQYQILMDLIFTIYLIRKIKFAQKKTALRYVLYLHKW